MSADSTDQLHAYRLVSHAGGAGPAVMRFRNEASHMSVAVHIIGDRKRLQVRCVFAHDTQPAYAAAESLRCAGMAWDYIGDLAHTGDTAPDLEIDTFQAGIGEVTFTGVDALLGPVGVLGDAYGEVAPW